MLDVLAISPYYPSYLRSGSAARFGRILEHFRMRGCRVHLIFAFRRARGCLRPRDLFQFVDRVSTIEMAGRQLCGVQSRHLQKVTRPRKSPLVRGAGSLQRWLTKTRDACDIVARIVRKERPQIVWVDHTFLAPLVARVPGGSTLRIVDTHDVMYLRDASLQRSGLPIEAGVTRQQEAQLLEPFDVVIAIQNRERQVLQEMLPRQRVISVEHALYTRPQPCRRQSLCFVGSAYVVNVETILSFVACAWPRIRAQCPQATLELVGGLCANQRVQAAAASDPQIILRGIVPSIADIYNGPMAVICPVWMGSGLKIKLVEALAHGKATIASPVAAQGLEDGMDRGFIGAATPEAFVEPAVKLLTDDRYRTWWQQAALHYAARFRPDTVYQQLDRILFTEHNSHAELFPNGAARFEIPMEPAGRHADVFNAGVALGPQHRGCLPVRRSSVSGRLDAKVDRRAD